MKGYYTNGQIRCTWTRKKTVTGNDKIFTLNPASYYLLLGTGSATSSGELSVTLTLPVFSYIVSMVLDQTERNRNNLV